MTQLKIAGIIPVRYASTRFPGKALVDIGGKSMLQRVIEKSAQVKGLYKLVVATDDSRIYEHVSHLGYPVVYTSVHHASGTDRCKEAMELACPEADYIINIQGDEPFLNPQQIESLAMACDGDKSILTQIKTCASADEILNPGEVKVVLNAASEALYFSRSVIPSGKQGTLNDWLKQITYYRHVGLYAYRCDVLKTIAGLPVSALEQLESLEQLRWLEAGHKIYCVVTPFESHCIDTPEDLDRLIKAGFLQRHGGL